MGIRVQGLDHVALAVGDQRATASWYRDVLASGILEACSNGRRGGLSEMACSQQSAVVAEIVRGTFGRDLAVRDDDAAVSDLQPTSTCCSTRRDAHAGVGLRTRA
jgi:hypothetical protein